MDRKKFLKSVISTGIVFGVAYISLDIVAKLKKRKEMKDEDLQKDKYEKAGKAVLPKKVGVYEGNVKPVIDKMLAFLGLIILSPLYLVISLTIYIDDPGPVLFTQKRVGKNKEFFRLHKFRSMKMSTPHDVPTHMLNNPEQYITRVGKILRKYSLDELPQIWDIFTGNMSVIGPRPALWNQVDLVAERDKYGANDVKPGLTGWAQINGRDELEIPVKAKLDGEYVARESFLFDIRCFAGTVISVFRHDGVVEGGTGKINEEILINKLFSPVDFSGDSELDLCEHKKILVMGAGSYIGESFKEYMEQWPDTYEIDTVDTTESAWREKDFEDYDVIYDVAGIAHIRETDENRHLYYEVNRDLAVEAAVKAKEAGVGLFVYLSTMAIYGMSVGKITKHTPIHPLNAYSISKIEAEKTLKELADDKFKVAIIKPPMVYGKDCKGNYQLLRKFAIKFGFFPAYKNERSMIYIDNLSSAIRGIIHYGESGSYFPQNPEYVNTCEMVKNIAKCNGRRFYSTKRLNLIIQIVSKRINLLQKVFGTLIYEQNMNVPQEWLEVKNTEETIYYTEQKKMRKQEKEVFHPKVSIISVSYNSEKTIARTIESVFNQTYDNIEYIIVDGVSKDNTVGIAESYQELFDRTPGRALTIISEPDNGMYDALNKGANLSTGKIIGQINTDDWYETDAVEFMVNLFSEENCDVAWGDIRIIKSSGNIIKHAKIGKFWTTSGWCHPGMFSKRDVLLEFPYVCESIYDDFDYITSVYQAKKKIVTTNHLISNFSFGGMSTQKNLHEVKKRIDILYKIYRKHDMSRLYWFHRVGIEMAKYILG